MVEAAVSEIPLKSQKENIVYYLVYLLQIQLCKLSLFIYQELEKFQLLCLSFLEILKSSGTSWQ